MNRPIILLLPLFSLMVAIVAGGCISASSAAARNESSKRAPTKSAQGLYLVKNAPTPLPAKTEMARFSAGCFWGVEDYFRNEPGVIATAVGFSGGVVPNPSYEDVCRGNTGHAETVEIEFDPAKTSYQKLVKLFFEIHDPTELNKQGPDVGEQYRSVIFYRTEDQHKIAQDTIAALNKTDDFKDEKIVTEVVPARQFYFAEDYHQQYIEKGGRAYCHQRTSRDFSKLQANATGPLVIPASLPLVSGLNGIKACPAPSSDERLGMNPVGCEKVKLLLVPGGPRRVYDD